MNLLVHALGAYLASQAASGRYPRPVAVGLAMLVSRLGAPTALMTLGAYALQKLNEAGAFAPAQREPAPTRRVRRGK